MAAPLHLGIFCDYRQTFFPEEETRAFVRHLLDGLMDRPAPPRITLLEMPRNRARYQPLPLRWGPHVQHAPSNAPPRTWRVELRDRLHEWAGRLAQFGNRWASSRDRAGEGFLKALIARFADSWQGCREIGLAAMLPAVIGLALLAGPLLLAGWLAALVYNFFLVFLGPMLSFPLRVLLAIAGEPVNPYADLDALIAGEDCDVWLVAHTITDHDLRAPQVLVLNGLIGHYAPDGLPGPVHEFLNRVIPWRIRSADLVFCPSPSVKEHDLRLALPDELESIRVFPLAAPPDTPRPLPDCTLNDLCRTQRFGSRFLLYPGTLEPRSNHRNLIQALRRLRLEHGDPLLELVCLTDRTPTADFWDVVDQAQLRGAVHFYHRLSPPAVELLYQHAQLVVFPSLYAENVLGVHEALKRGCPIACSDQPLYRDLFAAHPESALFFNPREPVLMARTIQRTIAQRERFRRWQTEAYREIGRRTWKEVGDDFMQLLAEFRPVLSLNHPANEEDAGTPVRERMSHAS